MTATNTSPETTEHIWRIPDDEKPGMYDTVKECVNCKRRVMHSVDNPNSLPRFGCTGIKSPLKTPPNEKDAFTIMMMLSVLADSRTDEEILYMLIPDKLEKALALMHEAKSKDKNAFNQRPW